MNFVEDVLAARPATDRAVITLSADGARREWTFGDLLETSGSLAAAFVERGVGRGGVVLTLVGNTAEYVLTMLACLRLGAPMLPCSEQLRAKDVAYRLGRARPALIVADERNRPVVEAAAPQCPVAYVPDPTLFAPQPPPPYADLGPLDPAFVLFTSGTSGEPKLVTHGQRYLTGQHLQAREWMAARPGELVWSTAAPGWSKSTRNCFIAPWLGGAAALLQDRRFDADERLATIRAERVNVLCMAPTEYRLIAAHGPLGPLPSLRRAITAGEALGVPAFEAWREQTGLEISDGYGQTETGQVTGVRPGESAPPGSMGRPLPGIEIEIVDGELTVDPATVPTFFLGYDGGTVPDGMWHTGDHVRQDDDGWLFFESRADDVIISAGYRIGPAEVESTLLGHPAVRECAVLGLPDESRGQIVAAAVVLRDGFTPSDELASDMQAHVRADTAPYKYPRRVWFLDALPKTNSGKIHRAELRPPG
ncbi:MAG TPA: AMP-binding protein [Jatrophihabitans sp.]|uniref:acyl-CoA synthetase n=1 Tax=Jatrophihabitans sp. TaxID=1932789 RepID=UPI002E03CA07|nr:AMP-binding protein [Jatrophihabitans sp.]